MSALKLCILSSEFLPYAKTGGLADVAGALGAEPAAAGSRSSRLHAAVFASVRAAHPELQPVPGVATRAAGHRRHGIPLLACKRRASPARTSRCTSSTARSCSTVPDFYTTDPDEHRRFLLFTRAALESCRQLEIAPDIFHCNDWHTAFLPLYLEDALCSRSAAVSARGRC